MTINDLTMSETLDAIVALARTKRGHTVLTCNVDHVILARQLASFRAAYAHASLVTADGAPLTGLGRLTRNRVVERVTGADLLPLLAERCATEALRLTLLGASPGIAEQASRRLRLMFPSLDVTPVCPPMGFEVDSSADLAVVAQVRSLSPDVLIVCLGAPKQELWMEAHRQDLACTMVGAGAAIDFITGRQRRAPRLLQRAGLEWAWRLATNWRRLWRRYLIRDAAFIPIAARELVARYGSTRSVSATANRPLSTPPFADLAGQPKPAGPPPDPS